MKCVYRRLLFGIRRYRRRHPVPAWGHLIWWIIWAPVYYYYFSSFGIDKGSWLNKVILIGTQPALFYIGIWWLLPGATRSGTPAARGGKSVWVLLLEVAAFLLLLMWISVVRGTLSFSLDFRAGWAFDILNIGEVLFPYVAMTCVLSAAFYLGMMLFREKQAREYLARVMDKQEHRMLLLNAEWLAAQMDPHLMVSLLTMFRGMSTKDPAILREAMDRVISIMRFYLVRGTAEVPVPVSEELAQVIKLAAITRMQRRKLLRFSVHTEGHLRGVGVMPMLLLMLTKNMFKYGILDDRSRPARLTVSRDEDLLFICAENHVREVPDVRGTGKGLQYITERLQVFHPGARFTYGLRGDKFVAEVHLRIVGPVSAVSNFQSPLS